MAKALGFQPHSLIKNIPSPSQQWKTPVNEWVRSLYESKFGSVPVSPQSAPAGLKESARVIEFRIPNDPWPDKPVIPELVVHMDALDEFGEEDDEFDPQLAFAREQYRERFEPPADEDIQEENTRMLRRQCLFRWAAQLIAVTTNALPEVQKVAAFGSVEQPLKNGVPRFQPYRRFRIEILSRVPRSRSWLSGLRIQARSTPEESDAARLVDCAGDGVWRCRKPSSGCTRFRCCNRRLPGQAVHIQRVPQGQAGMPGTGLRR